MKTSNYFASRTLLGGAIAAFSMAAAFAIGGSFLMLLISLYSEDQRNFLKCRASGNSVDYCLKLISGV